MHPSDVLLQVRLLVRTKHTVRAVLLLVLAAEYLLVLDQVPLPLVALRAPSAGILVLHPVLGLLVRVVFKGARILHALRLFLLFVPESLIGCKRIPVRLDVFIFHGVSARGRVAVKRVDRPQSLVDSTLFGLVEIQEI